MSVPGNVYFMMELMGSLTQKDMYPTDEIYEALFNFTEKDYPKTDEEPIEEVEYVPGRMLKEQEESITSPEMVAGYEMLGYDNSNFVPLSGSGLINILIAVVSIVIYNIARYICRTMYRYQIARKIGLGFPRVNHYITLVRFFIEGYLELFFNALISVISLSSDEISRNPSDTFSALFACFSLVVLLILPVYMTLKIRKH